MELFYNLIILVINKPCMDSFSHYNTHHYGSKTGNTP